MLYILWYAATFQYSDNQLYWLIFVKNVYDKDVFAVCVKYDNFLISFLINIAYIVVCYALL